MDDNFFLCMPKTMDKRAEITIPIKSNTQENIELKLLVGPPANINI